jgi:4-amino-4-deoxy-L-arabinose transferase-like glycosyltransferase
MRRVLETFADRLKPHLYLWVALTVAIPRLVFLVVQPERSLSGNAPALLAIADNLLAGEGFRDDTGTPDGHFSPVYVGVLAASRAVTHRSLVLVKLAHIIFDILTALLLSSLLARLLPTAAIMLFALGFAFHPLVLYYANNLNEECLLTLAVTISFVAVYRALEKPSAGTLILAGMAGGLATMVKGSALFLPFLIAVVGCLFVASPARGKWLLWMAYLGASLIVLMPWGYRNYVVFGRFSINPRGFGQNLWWGSDPRIFANYGNNREEGVRQSIAEMTAKGLGRPDTNDLFGMERWEFEMGLENYKELLSHPGELIRILWMKASRTVYASENRPSAHAALIAIQFPLILLAVLGWWRFHRVTGTRQLAILLAVFIGYFFAVVSAGLPMVRYFLPAIPLLIVAAAFGFLGFVKMKPVE